MVIACYVREIFTNGCFSFTPQTSGYRFYQNLGAILKNINNFFVAIMFHPPIVSLYFFQCDIIGGLIYTYLNHISRCNSGLSVN